MSAGQQQADRLRDNMIDAMAYSLGVDHDAARNVIATLERSEPAEFRRFVHFCRRLCEAGWNQCNAENAKLPANPFFTQF